MKVHQLIKLLQDEPPDSDVMLSDADKEQLKTWATEEMDHLGM